ncbi:MAG TPA: choice-of-anchor tandem repeat GloVer-containing protein [Verrucomicrobiae bacterium]|nr:choice-of-anchor tandem repeat GloVer-containing protein [Verrucomicrobiae bacterium]
MKTLAVLLAVGAVALAVVSNHAQAQTFSTLYDFGSPSDGTNGTFPNCLIVGTDGNLYGTAAGGGTNGSGTAFKLTTEGTFTLIHTFCNTIVCPGAPEEPNGLVQGTDGILYGTTSLGGANNEGAVFKLTTQGTFSTLYSFCTLTNCLDGSTPKVPLILGSDGNFYGTTTGGGSNDEGTVFRITPQGTLTTIYEIPNSLAVGAITQVPIYQGSDSNFYGISDTGGTEGDGLVFQLTSQGTFTAIYNFCTATNTENPCADGSSPLAPLIEVGGNLYGTTRGGGLGANGTVFSMPLDGLPAGSLIPFASFCNGGCASGEGQDPTSALVFGSDSNFYGTTSRVEGLFQLTPEGALTMIHDFCTVTNGGNDCVDGAIETDHPAAAIVQGHDGKLYGVTDEGGLKGDGVVFKLDMGLGPIGPTCTYSINPTNITFAARGGSDAVAVTAPDGCTWDAQSNNGFITITSGSNGTGSGYVEYSVAANTNSTAQIGTMTIADQTFTITESGTSSTGGCAFTVTPATIALTSKGGSKSVSVKVKDKTCAWTAISNDPFITITSGSSGTGGGKVAFSVPGNTNGTTLSGTMTIAGETVTVNQAAGGCTFKLSPKSGKLKATGGSATIKVSPNFSDCDWTATTTDSFITITSGASGMGKGTVTYSVPANTNTTPVSGSITIGGQTFTVTQAGAK